MGLNMGQNLVVSARIWFLPPIQMACRTRSRIDTILPIDERWECVPVTKGSGTLQYCLDIGTVCPEYVGLKIMTVVTAVNYGVMVPTVAYYSAENVKVP
jgi:hypothetical protein